MDRVSYEDLLEDEPEDQDEPEGSPEPTSSDASGWGAPGSEERKAELYRITSKLYQEQQKALREAPIKELAAERTRLEDELSKPDLDVEDEVEKKARLAFVTARVAEVEASLPFAETKTSDLEAQAEEAEERRDDARDAWEQALAVARASGRSAPSAKARRLKREFDEATEHKAQIDAEVRRRGMAELNRQGFAGRAAVHAERQLRSEDARALEQAKDWRRGRLQEQLAESFASRLAERSAKIEKQMWADAEVEVGRSLLLLPPGPSLSERDRQRETEAKLEAARKKHDPAYQKEGTR